MGDPVGVATTTDFARRPTIMSTLDFNRKLHKIYYDQDCKACFHAYDVDAGGRHTFVTALAFKAVKFCWVGDHCGIIDISKDEFNFQGFELHKNILEHDG